MTLWYIRKTFDCQTCKTCYTETESINGRIIMLGVRLSDDLSERLNALSYATNRPKSFYVREALEEYLCEHQELYAVISEYETLKKNKKLKTFSLDDVKKKHGLA